MLLEKIFAKVHCSYENALGASMLDIWNVLLGIPGKEHQDFFFDNGFDMSDSSVWSTAADTAWITITEELKKGTLIGINFQGPSSYYSIVAAYTVIDSSTFRLIKIRSPSGTDSWTGDWSDGDTTHWTTTAKAQAPYVNDASDGEFLIEITDLI